MIFFSQPEKNFRRTLDSSKEMCLPSCIGSMVCIINWSKPCRNLAPVTAAGSLLPGTAERDSDAALDVTEPPGCVAIDVSDEFAALFFLYHRLIDSMKKIDENQEERKHFKNLFAWRRKSMWNCYEKTLNLNIVQIGNYIFIIISDIIVRIFRIWIYIECYIYRL